MLIKKRKKSLMSILTVLITLAILSFLVLPQSVMAVKTSKDFLSDCKAKITEAGLKKGLEILKSGDYVILDARTYKENKRGTIPGAINIPRGKLEFKINEKIADKNTKILVFCKKGGRSVLATCTLKQMGYINAVAMNPGFDAWLEAGNPVE